MMLMRMLMRMLMPMSEVGGDESDVSPTPEPGNRFRFRLRLRCVRACERAKLRARDDSSVAGAGRANLWGSVRPVRPSVHPATLNKKFEQ